MNGFDAVGLFSYFLTYRVEMQTLILLTILAADCVTSFQTYDEGKEPVSPCSAMARIRDVQPCLQAIRKRAEDPTIFWFGNSYPASCLGQNEYLADCYNPRAKKVDSLISRLFNLTELDPDILDRYLEVTYSVKPGVYKACENHYQYGFEREVTLDPMSMTVMTPFEVRAQPTLRWRADDSKQLYTLLFYDVGYFYVKAMYTNIPGNNFTLGDGILEYEGPLNPTRNNNPYVFLLFSQEGPITLDNKWKQKCSIRKWESELVDFIEAHNLTGPLALNWVLVFGDAYGAEAKRARGEMNTCAHFVSEVFRHHEVEFIPNRTYYGDPLLVSVFINVTFEAPSMVVNSCCNIHTYHAKTFNLNPLGDPTVLPAHTRSDVPIYVTLHMTTAFPDTQRDFKDKTLTLLVADPDVPFQAFGNPRLPFVHWLVTNIRGGDVASGDVVQGYMGPAPPDPKPHRYYYLLFQQSHDLDPTKMDYSAVNCSWNFRGRCRFDVLEMVSANNLTLIGVTWMISQFDEFVREMYVQAGMNPRCAACHGVPGYADPCPLLRVNAVDSCSVPVFLLSVCLLLYSMMLL